MQGTVEEQQTVDGNKHYEAVECNACRGFHFVNVATLKLLSDEVEDQPRRGRGSSRTPSISA